MRRRIFFVVITFVVLFGVGILLVFLSQKTINTPNKGVFRTPSHANFENYQKIVDKAVKYKNPSICDEIDFGEDYGDYMGSVEENRYYCRSDYATGTGDVRFCRTLDVRAKYTGITQRNKCLRDLAQKLNDEKLCDEMVDGLSDSFFTKEMIEGCKSNLNK